MSIEVTYSPENPAEHLATQLIEALQELSLEIENKGEFKLTVIVEIPPANESIFERHALRFAVTYQKEQNQIKIETDLVMCIAEQHKDKVYFWKDLGNLQSALKKFLEVNFPELLSKFLVYTELPYKDSNGQFHMDFDELDQNHLSVADHQTPFQHIAIGTLQFNLSEEFPTLLGREAFQDSHLPRERSYNGIPFGSLPPYYAKELGLERHKDQVIEVEFNRLSDYIGLNILTDGGPADIEVHKQRLIQELALGFGVANILEAWSSTLHDIVYLPAEPLPDLEFDLSDLSAYKAGNLALLIEERVRQSILAFDREEDFEEIFDLELNLPEGLDFVDAFVEFHVYYNTKKSSPDKAELKMDAFIRTSLNKKHNDKVFKTKNLIELFNRILPKLPVELARLAKIMTFKKYIPKDVDKNIFTPQEHYSGDSIIIGSRRRPKANASQQDKDDYLYRSFYSIHLSYASIFGDDDEHTGESEENRFLGNMGDYEGAAVDLELEFQRPLLVNALLFQNHPVAKEVRDKYFQLMEERLLTFFSLFSEISDWAAELKSSKDIES